MTEQKKLFLLFQIMDIFDAFSLDLQKYYSAMGF